MRPSGSYVRQEYAVGPSWSTLPEGHVLPSSRLRRTVILSRRVLAGFEKSGGSAC